MTKVSHYIIATVTIPSLSFRTISVINMCAESVFHKCSARARVIRFLICKDKKCESEHCLVPNDLTFTYREQSNECVQN